MTQIGEQPTNRQTVWAKTVRWVSLFVIGTVVVSSLAWDIPYLSMAMNFLIYTTTFRLHARFPNLISVFPTPLKITSGPFAGTDTYVEDVLTFVLTGIYFGIVLALVSSGNKRQILIGAGLVIIYLGTSCLVLYLAILNLS